MIPVPVNEEAEIIGMGLDACFMAEAEAGFFAALKPCSDSRGMPLSAGEKLSPLSWRNLLCLIESYPLTRE